MLDKDIAGVGIGQGASPNNAPLVTLLSAGNQLGIEISLSHDPTRNPAGCSIDGGNARKTLVVGKAAADAGATFVGPLPPPTLTVVGRSGLGGAWDCPSSWQPSWRRSLGKRIRSRTTSGDGIAERVLPIRSWRFWRQRNPSCHAVHCLSRSGFGGSSDN